MKKVTGAEKRIVYVLLSLLVLFGGMIAVNAFGGVDPAVMGHSAGEVEGGGLPSGAVVSFNMASCPSGWSEFTNAKGRVVVGRNKDDSSFNGLRETGGAKTHKLTVAQMPSHTHAESGGRCTSGCDGWYGAYSRDPVHYLYTPASKKALTASTGSSSAHNNLQPYIALLYCQKD